MLDIEGLHNTILYLMGKSDTCVKKAIQNKAFLKLFDSDQLASFIAKEFLEWYKEFNTVPSPKRIDEKHKDATIGPRLHIRIANIAAVAKLDPPPAENEFDSYLNELKMAWMKGKVSEGLHNYGSADVSKINEVAGLSKSIKDFGHQFVKISDAVIMSDEGEYSYTTENAEANIEKIKSNDITKEKRFKIGQRMLDNATKGFRYGDLFMILGDGHTGKSMVLANMAYNLWRNDANVLLLTCEMKPEEFDERIYSRATAVKYDSIMAGGDSLGPPDLVSLETCKREMLLKKNKIITKFLKGTDNVGTVEGYIDDLKLRKDFIPDVVIIDSLADISPLNAIIENKDNLKVAQVVIEFKEFAQAFMDRRGVVVISTHQAKVETRDKKFDEIHIGDFGRTKVAADKADFAAFIRSDTDLNTMDVKLIKGRRVQAGLAWSMAIDFSKVLVADTQNSLNTLNTGIISSD